MAQKKTIRLGNVIYWDHCEDDKVYLSDVRIAIADFPFTQRLVFLRLSNGLSFESSIADLDRVAIEYLKLRGIPLPHELNELASAEPPLPGDFVVPTALLNSISRAQQPKEPTPPVNRRTPRKKK